MNAVCNKQDCLTPLTPDAKQFQVHLLPGDLVKRAKRLIHQEEERVKGERPGNRYTLSHSTGQLVWKAVIKALKTYQLEQLFQPPIVQLSAHDAAEKTDVLPHGLPLQENTVLKNESNLTIAAESYRLLTGDLDNPRCRGN